MQKLLVAILLIVSTTSFAQRNKVNGEHENFFRFGAKGGVNVNKITGQSYKDGLILIFRQALFYN